MDSKAVDFIGVSRHRIMVDGEGVTTLAAFWGCPLSCAYCLNPQCARKDGVCVSHTPQSLFDYVKIDQLYFLATGGGVTFGGGEPLLHPDFICEFRQLCGPEWNLSLETSLNVPLVNLAAVADVVDHYIVDIKDMNEVIYQSYTGKSPGLMLANLKLLADLGLQDHVTVRIPLIEAFNSQSDVERSEEKILSMGFSHLNKFTYKTVIDK